MARKHKGGLAVGKSHKQGGMKGIITQTKEPIEFQGNEVIIKAESVALPGNCEKLSQINESGGGDPIPCHLEELEQFHKEVYQEGGAVKKSAFVKIIPTQEKSDKLMQIIDEFGIPVSNFNVSKSKTDFGESHYFKFYDNEFNPIRTIRVSDHSVGQRRLRDELSYDALVATNTLEKELAIIKSYTDLAKKYQEGGQLPSMHVFEGVRHFEGLDPLSYDSEAQNKYGNGIYLCTNKEKFANRGKNMVNLKVIPKNPIIFDSTNSIPNINFTKGFALSGKATKAEFLDSLFAMGHDAVVIKHNQEHGDEIVFRDKSIVSGYMKKEDQLESLEKRKQELLKEVTILSDQKKAQFGNVDISEPMSKQEKDLDKAIASVYSEINDIVSQKQKLKKFENGGAVIPQWDKDKEHYKDWLVKHFSFWPGEIGIFGKKLVKIIQVGADRKYPQGFYAYKQVDKDPSSSFGYTVKGDLVELSKSEFESDFGLVDGDHGTFTNRRAIEASHWSKELDEYLAKTVKESKNAEDFHKKLSALKGIPKELSEHFFYTYGKVGDIKLSPKQASEKYYDYITGKENELRRGDGFMYEGNEYEFIAPIGKDSLWLKSTQAGADLKINKVQFLNRASRFPRMYKEPIVKTDKPVTKPEIVSIESQIKSLETALKYATAKNKKSLEKDIQALKISLKYS